MLHTVFSIALMLYAVLHSCCMQYCTYAVCSIALMHYCVYGVLHLCDMINIWNKRFLFLTLVSVTMYFVDTIRNNVCEHVTIINISWLTLVSWSNWFVELIQCFLYDHCWTWLWDLLKIILKLRFYINLYANQWLIFERERYSIRFHRYKYFG